MRSQERKQKRFKKENKPKDQTWGNWLLGSYLSKPGSCGAHIRTTWTPAYQGIISGAGAQRYALQEVLPQSPSRLMNVNICDPCEGLARRQPWNALEGGGGQGGFGKPRPCLLSGVLDGTTWTPLLKTVK